MAGRKKENISTEDILKALNSLSADDSMKIRRALANKDSDDNSGECPQSLKEKKEFILNELNSLVNKYNEHAEFNEFEEMKKVDVKINDAVDEYIKASKQECFDELLKADKPLKAAAEKLRFNSLRVKDEKLEEGGTIRVVDSTVTKLIDPLELHKKAKEGIGENKKWFYFVERLNMILTARRAIELGLDPKTVNDSFAMNEESKKLEGFLVDETTLDLNEVVEHLLQNMQKVVEAMIGEGYDVKKEHVNYLLSIFAKKDSKKSLSVSCANHKYMRMYMLEVCNAVITNNKISMNYKTAK